MLKSPLSRLFQTSRHLAYSTTRPISTSSDRPSGLIAKSGIELLTFGTPNGVKASIVLEELKAAYGKEYTYQSINIGQNIQKEAWYTKYCPNGRIPVIIDHDRNGFAVFEGLAILSYLTRHYDPDHKISFDDPDDISRAEQWMAWQHGGLGPMQGQANHFYRFTKDRIPYPTQRYVGETERLYGVLDRQLQDREYLVGPGRGRFSIADIASFGWVNGASFSGIDLARFPGVQSWWERIAARPAVQRGLSVPTPGKFGNVALKRRVSEDPEFRKSEEGLRDALARAQEEFGYKYSSP